MKNFSHKHLFLIILLLAVFFVFFRLVKLWSFPDTNWKLAKGEKIDLEVAKSLNQKFIASRDNLSRIDILFSGSGIKPGGIIDLQLSDETCRQVLRKDSLKVSSLDAENSYPFRFAKIAAAENKIFCLSLTYAPRLENGKKAKIFLLENSPAGSELFSVAGEKLANQALAIRPAYQNENLWGNIREMNQRISQYKPWFLKSTFLNFIVFSFLIFSFALVTLLILL